MSSANAIYGGQFLNFATAKSERLFGRTFEIESIRPETMKERERLVLCLLGTEKEFILNKTNCSVLVDAYGDDYDAWVGKRVMLVATKANYQGQSVDAVGVVVPQ